MEPPARNEWKPFADPPERDETAVTETEPGDVEAALLPREESSDAWLKMQSQLDSGVGWFNWIAALSLINVVIFLVGGDRSFVIGLGITQVITGIADVVAQREPALMWTAKGIALVLSVAIAALFATFALLGKRRHVWAIALGMVLYLLDALLFVLLSDWMSVGFHAFALFCLWCGLTAALKLNAWERQSPPELEYAT